MNQNKLLISKNNLIFFVSIFLLLYIEPVEIYGIKISQIWKGLLVLFLFFKLFYKSLPYFYFFGIAFSLKYLFFSSFPYGIQDNLRLALESLLFPLSLGYFISFYNDKNLILRIHKYIILMSLFFIFSSIPFLLGLKSLNPEYSLFEKYRIIFSSPKGLFYHIASASKIYVVSTIFIILYYDYFNHSKYYKLLFYISILLGSFLIIMTWTRTSWLVYFLSILLILFYKSTFKSKLIGYLFIIFLSFSFIFLYNNVQAFKWRLTGGASYRSERSFSIEQIINSRFPYIITAIDNLKSEGLLISMIGYGELYGRDLFNRKIYMRITSHNATFEILESNGIIGLVLFFSFFFSLYYFVYSKFKDLNNNEIRKLILIFFLYLSFFLLSHGTPIWGELLFSMYLSTIINKNESITYC